MRQPLVDSQRDPSGFWPPPAQFCESPCCQSTAASAWSLLTPLASCKTWRTLFLRERGCYESENPTSGSRCGYPSWGAEGSPPTNLTQPILNACTSAEAPPTVNELLTYLRWASSRVPFLFLSGEAPYPIPFLYCVSSRISLTNPPWRSCAWCPGSLLPSAFIFVLYLSLCFKNTTTCKMWNKQLGAPKNVKQNSMCSSQHALFYCEHELQCSWINFAQKLIEAKLGFVNISLVKSKKKLEIWYEHLSSYMTPAQTLAPSYPAQFWHKSEFSVFL
jgi:hypothetical protein